MKSAAHQAKSRRHILLILIVSFIGLLAVHGWPSIVPGSQQSVIFRIKSPDQPLIQSGILREPVSAIRTNSRPQLPAASYQASPDTIHGAITASNPGQGFTLRFDENGIAVNPLVSAAGSSSSVRLHTSLVDSASQLRSDIRFTPRIAGQRVEYRHPGYTEWYLNTQLGLEQGWTLNSPMRHGRGVRQLRITLADGLITGQNSDAISIQSGNGQMQLRYSHLTAWDAYHKPLPARMVRMGDQQIALYVDDTRANYPVTIDPDVTAARQVAELVPSDGMAKDAFGNAVAVDGDTAVAGALGKNNQIGVAYIFRRDQGGAGLWGQVAEITPPNGASRIEFGRSVAISGDTVLVGAQNLGSTGKSAYVYQRDQGGAGVWGLVTELTSNDGSIIGQAVAISGDIAVVGPSASEIPSFAYVFERNMGGTNHWGQVARLSAADASADNVFGFSVAIDGDTIVCAAIGDNNFRGAAYIFERNLGGADNWGQRAKVIAADGGPNAGFGHSVAISGDTVIVGQTQGSVAGAAYVFQRDQGGVNSWGQTAKLVANDPKSLDQFGISVSVNGDLALVGAYAGSAAQFFQGTAYVFARNQNKANGWGQVVELLAADAAQMDQFGSGVSVSGNTAIVGADNRKGIGASYIFTLNTSPTPQPAVSLSQTSLDFGSLIVGKTSATQQIVLTNSGNATLLFNGSAIAISPYPAQFEQTNNCPSALAVAASCNISISFAPNAAGSFSNMLTIDTNDPAGPASVQLTGTGAAAHSGTLQFVTTSYAVQETAASVLLSVQRVNGSDLPVTVSYATQDGTATAPGDYLASAGTLTWADGDVASKTISIPIVTTSKFKNLSQFTVVLSNPAGGAIVGAVNPATVTIADIPPSTSGSGGGAIPFDFLAAFSIAALRRKFRKPRAAQL